MNDPYLIFISPKIYPKNKFYILKNIIIKRFYKPKFYGYTNSKRVLLATKTYLESNYNIIIKYGKCNRTNMEIHLYKSNIDSDYYVIRDIDKKKGKFV